jgi:isoaspartyl peptidase/L-asparaginase-like protein (Ntn-hydrolase superfamily)
MSFDFGVVPGSTTPQYIRFGSRRQHSVITITAMDLKLPAQLKQFVEREVKNGRFDNATGAINEALRLLEQRDRVAAGFGAQYAVLGSVEGSDIMTLAFIV